MMAKTAKAKWWNEKFIAGFQRKRNTLVIIGSRKPPPLHESGVNSASKDSDIYDISADHGIREPFPNIFLATVKMLNDRTLFSLNCK